MVVQWGVSNVYKVGGKVFANADNETISFKASEIAYEALVADERGRRAPYTQPGANRLNLPLTDPDVGALVVDAHALIVAKLTKKARAELGL